METGRFAIGDYQIGRVTQLPAINYAYPLVGPVGGVERVVFVAQSLNWLTAALSNVAFPSGAIAMERCCHACPSRETGLVGLCPKNKSLP